MNGEEMAAFIRLRATKIGTRAAVEEYRAALREAERILGHDKMDKLPSSGSLTTTPIAIPSRY